MWNTLRKFSMDCCDLPTMLWNVTTMLKLIALDVDPRNKKPVGLIFYVGLIFVSVCYYYVYLVSMIWFVFVRCKETGDLFAAVVVMSLGASSEMSITKLWCMFAQRKKIKQLIKAFLACDDQVLPNSRFTDHMNVTLRAVKKRAIIVWSVIIVNGIIYTMAPLLYSERRHVEEKFEFFGFGNMTMMKISPYYEVAYSLNVIGAFVTCYPAANIYAFFIIIAGYIEAQMLALTQELTHVWKDAEKYHDNHSSSMLRHLKQSDSATIQKQNNFQTSSLKYPNTDWSDKEVTSRTTSHLRHSTAKNNNQLISEESTDAYRQIALNAYVRKRLAEVLESHSTNINLLHQVDGVFRIAIAIELILMGLGLTAELLGDLKNTFIQVPFTLMSVCIECFTGQCIKNASTAFEKAVYDSSWENFDVTNRKTILLMLRVSQKEMKLSSGNIATLDLECLMSVFKTTYSAFTTLRSTMN